MHTAPRFLQCMGLIVACLAASCLFHASAAASPPSGEDNRQSLEVAVGARERLIRKHDWAIVRGRFRKTAISLFLELDWCRSAYRLLRFDPDDPAADPYIRARLFQIGLCAPRRPSAVLPLLHRALNEPELKAIAYARLGEAYLAGDGVDRDLRQADEYFRLALFTRGWAVASRVIRNQDIDLAALFGDVFEPSWNLSDRFLSSLEQLRTDLAARPKAIVELALSYCNLDTPPCAHTAFDWIYVTAKHLGNAEANYHYAQLLLLPQIPKARLAARLISPGTSSSRRLRVAKAADAFVKAGRAGHIAAIKRLISLLWSQPETTDRNMALYFWTLRLQRLDTDAEAPTHNNLHYNLSQSKKDIVEEMEKHVKRCCLPPLIWHSPPQTWQPRD